jgi:transposase
LQLVPVTVADTATAAGAAATQNHVGRMEIALNSGERVVGADVDASSLARVVKALSRR